MRRIILLLCVCSFIFFCPVEPARAQQVKWETFNGGFFSIEKPQGWQVTISGACSMFSFIISDPQHPLRRVFYIGEVGPFYLNEQQRMIDLNYMRMNGFPIQWINLPSVYPLTTENFFRQFYRIAREPAYQNFLRAIPLLDNFQVVSVQQSQTPLNGADAKTVRAVFSEFNAIGEGMFFAAVAQNMPFDGMSASAGTGMAYFCSGISSYQNDFKQWEPILARCLQSLNFSPGYLEQCLQSQATIWKGIRQIGKTWNEISNIIDKVWENQSKVYDACSAKYSAVMRGVERMRDSRTGEVYEVNSGMADKIESNNGRYSNLDLERVADNDYDAWNGPSGSLR